MKPQTPSQLVAFGILGVFIFLVMEMCSPPKTVRPPDPSTRLAIKTASDIMAVTLTNAANSSASNAVPYIRVAMLVALSQVQTNLLTAKDPREIERLRDQEFMITNTLAHIP